MRNRFVFGNQVSASLAEGGGADREWLLTDGTGPLYSPDGRTTLVTDAAQALRELRPWPA